MVRGSSCQKTGDVLDQYLRSLLEVLLWCLIVSDVLHVAREHLRE